MTFYPGGPPPESKRPRTRKKNKLSDQNMKIHDDTKAFVKRFVEEERAEDEETQRKAAEWLKPARREAGEKCG